LERIYKIFLDSCIEFEGIIEVEEGIDPVSLGNDLTPVGELITFQVVGLIYVFERKKK
jgi:hypothetical protein